MSFESSMLTYYAERAGEYERIYHKPERQADLEKLRSRVGNAFAGADVLEVACGTGYWTEILACSAASVFATDISEEVLNVARSKHLDPRVTFQKQDAYTIPPSTRRFTAGFSAFWWSHVARPKSSISRKGFTGPLLRTPG